MTLILIKQTNFRLFKRLWSFKDIAEKIKLDWHTVKKL